MLTFDGLCERRCIVIIIIIISKEAAPKDLKQGFYVKQLYGLHYYGIWVPED